MCRVRRGGRATSEGRSYDGIEAVSAGRQVDVGALDHHASPTLAQIRSEKRHVQRKASLDNILYLQ